MLLEIIFKGLFSILNLGFLPKLLVNAKDVRFNHPEISNPENHAEISKIFKNNEYVDFVIISDEFCLDGKITPKVFINLTKDKDNFEMLIYFDLHDFNKKDEKNGIDDLINWADSFKRDYSFNYYVCQIDNANEKEYYFNSNGLGPLYQRLSR